MLRRPRDTVTYYGIMSLLDFFVTPKILYPILMEIFLRKFHGEQYCPPTSTWQKLWKNGNILSGVENTTFIHK